MTKTLHEVKVQTHPRKVQKKQVICTVTLETFFKCLECPFDIVEAHVKHFDPPGNKSQVLLEEVLCEGIILKRK